MNWGTTMKYTIEGFSQAEALKFRRTEMANGKERVVALDCVDLHILRWIVDFWPRMKKVEIGGEQYGWLRYEALLEDYPLLGIKKRMLALRLKKMVDFGILTHKTVRCDGTFSYYGFGPNYVRLIDDRRDEDVDIRSDGTKAQSENPRQSIDHPSQKIDEGYAIDCPPLVNKLTTPSQKIDEQINPSTKDPSTSNPSTNIHTALCSSNNSYKEIKKKVSKSFDELIDGFTDNEDLRNSLRGFLQSKFVIWRKQNKVLTSPVLEADLTRLADMSSDPYEMKMIVDKAVSRGGDLFYSLTDSEKPYVKDEADLRWEANGGF